MCCLVEIGMTVWGMVTLSQRKFGITRKTAVHGRRAVMIGTLLTLTFPLAAGVGFVVGVAEGLNNPDGPVNPLDFVWVDIAFVLGILTMVTLIALTGVGGRKTNRRVDAHNAPPVRIPSPASSDNPYAAPPSEPPKSQEHMELEQAWEDWGAIGAVAQPRLATTPPPASATPAEETPQPRRNWYYSLDNKHRKGPITTEQLKQLIAAGALTQTSLVSSDGKKWHRAGKLDGIQWP